MIPRVWNRHRSLAKLFHVPSAGGGVLGTTHLRAAATPTSRRTGSRAKIARPVPPTRPSHCGRARGSRLAIRNQSFVTNKDKCYKRPSPPPPLPFAMLTTLPFCHQTPPGTRRHLSRVKPPPRHATAARRGYQAANKNPPLFVKTLNRKRPLLLPHRRRFNVIHESTVGEHNIRERTPTYCHPHPPPSTTKPEKPYSPTL